MNDLNVGLVVSLSLSYLIAIIGIMRNYEKESKFKRWVDWLCSLLLTIALGTAYYFQQQSDKESSTRITQLKQGNKALSTKVEELKSDLADIQTASFFSNQKYVGSPVSSDGSDFCFLTIIPNGAEGVHFAIYNPLPITLHHISFAVSGYDSLKHLKPTRTEQGFNFYSETDVAKTIVFGRQDIDVKPGVHLFTEHNLLLGNNDAFNGSNMAVFEVTIQMGSSKNVFYRENLAATLSSDHLSAEPAFDLYKIMSNTDSEGYFQLKGFLLRSGRALAFPRDFIWHKYFNFPILRLYTN